NRVGDLAMILAMILTFWTFGSLEFDPVFAGAIEMFESGHEVHFGAFSATLGGVLTEITALILMGAAGKSAQIPLYVWLPDAMAGPTPVSALIHAATMVTSGIYLIVRSNVLFEIVRVSDTYLIGSLSSADLVALTGAATALFAGLIAFTQFDIKKVLAYSTVSQLGFMIAAIGMGAYVAGMFHLITHAFFKALLFLGSGSVIHGMEHGHHHISHGSHDDHDMFDPQDMRTMGGLRHKMPWTFRTYMVGALALAGIVPLAGFWSKDEILAHASEHNALVYWVLVAAAFCTAFYMGRQLKMTFFGEARHEAADHAHESPSTMTVPLIILAVLAILGGLLNLPFLSDGIEVANHSHPGGVWLGLEAWLEHSIGAFELDAEGLIHLPHTPKTLSPLVAGLSTLFAVVALAASFFGLYGKRPSTADDPDPMPGVPIIGPIIWWFRVLPFDTLYMKGFIPLFNRFAEWLAHTFDWAFWHDFVHNNIIRDFFVGGAKFVSTLDEKGLDGLVVGTGHATRRLAGLLRRTQSGYARTYALGVFLGTVILLAYFLWPMIAG
ncbi:MAG: hypothetical protein GY943_11155, partial [Chloroflexi bacterium]|nr:hypothetical protein [Chloroflexota bacterium]